jgi:hypothetical protein
VMLTIVWNPGGFHLVNILPKWIKFNASYYATQILDPLSKWRRTQLGRTNRKLIVHADNACPHTAKWHRSLWSRIRCRGHHIQHTHPIWHLLISISLAMLSNSCQFADQDSLLQAVSDILVGIENVTLESVFYNWVGRLCQCSAAGGE